MTAPTKPWEVTGINTRMAATPSIQNVTNYSRLQSSPTVPTVLNVPSCTPLNVRRVRTVPVPPPRPQGPILRQNYIPNNTHYLPYASYGSYGTSYGGYSGIGGYGSTYGGYGSYGGYGTNRFGHNFPENDPESRFIQMVEESSRPAFQSIESLVHAFGSVSFMMESTFNAVYSSFQAVLGVAENFGRLRTMFGQFFSTFAVLRTLQWLYKKLLYLIGLRQENPGREAIWRQAVAGTSELPTGMNSKDTRASWPIVMFVGILFIGPYLAWKLISSLSTFQSINPYNTREWKESKDVSCPAVALYDFTAASEKELGFNAGQTMTLAPKELQPQGARGWLLATLDGTRVGCSYNECPMSSSHSSEWY
ncbi:peroxisomal membrane protein PEX13 isoform X2 [Zootermopsis nevadensis]|uniref:peroxisomal membrane protein PEX13 isoform X2 n=1 Tax=Zootermopsis nevadensis TaxID=136037 RepID=UPI000B8E93E8|nr:peroxisomal membrane protein PEX13 isoform X2 [Zootermopsis nevadensis]